MTIGNTTGGMVGKERRLMLTKCFTDCVNFLGIPSQRATNWVALNNRNLVPNSSGDWKSDIKVLTGPCSL